MEVVASEITFDAQRVVETLEDGSTATRPASMGEQCDAMQQEILEYVVRMVPHALSGTIVVDTDHAGGMAVLSISLSGTARAIPIDTPDDLPTIDSRPDGGSLHIGDEDGKELAKADDKAHVRQEANVPKAKSKPKAVQTRSGTRSA